MEDLGQFPHRSGRVARPRWPRLLRAQELRTTIGGGKPPFQTCEETRLFSSDFALADETIARPSAWQWSDQRAGDSLVCRKGLDRSEWLAENTRRISTGSFTARPGSRAKRIAVYW